MLLCTEEPQRWLPHASVQAVSYAGGRTDPKRIRRKLVAAIIDWGRAHVTEAGIVTVGHSNHTLERFLGLLARHRVTAVADVRSAPYSRFRPHFNRKALEASLDARGIRYAFFGRELGGRPDDLACYERGRVDYERVAATRGFRDGVARVIDAASRYRMAIMCAEKEPLDCHRTLLVARALDAAGVAVEHILADGALETHGRTMDRLLAAFDLNQDCDLFRRREELVADAIALQARRVAYVRRGASTTTAGGRSR